MSIGKPPSSRVEKTRAIDAGPRSVNRHGVFTIANGIDAGRVLVIPPAMASTFGRATECTFSFDDESLSREHAVVIRAAGEYMIKDVSTNGSFVNDIRLTAPSILRDGDRVQLGSNTLLRFQFVDPEEESALRRVYEAAHLDGLTGIYNRKHLEERITAELASAIRHDEPLSIIIFDVDHFKKVNDTHGHLAGDAVLKSVCALIKSVVRPEDIVARYGGEEVFVVARSTDAIAARALAERVREAVAAAPIAFEAAREIQVTISAGIASLACCGENARDRATLISIADRRLYAAKHRGRNQVVGVEETKG